MKQIVTIPSPDEPLMDVPALARYLCVNVSFVRRLVRERRIPFHKLGVFIRFNPAEVNAWIDERRVDVYLP